MNNTLKRIRQAASTFLQYESDTFQLVVWDTGWWGSKEDFRLLLSKVRGVWSVIEVDNPVDSAGVEILTTLQFKCSDDENKNDLIDIALDKQLDLDGGNRCCGVDACDEEWDIAGNGGVGGR